MKPSRYKTRQYLIRPRQQWIFTLRLIAFAAIAQGWLILAAEYYLTGSQIQVASAYGLGDVAMAALLGALNRGLALVFFWSASVFAIVAALVGLRYSHRFFGPVVPMRRLIDELTAGRYGGQLKLRRKDELTEIGEALNELSRVLAERAKGDAR